MTLLVGAPPVEITSASQQASPPTKPLPVFEIDRIEHNFGDVFLGEDLSCVFEIHNQGTAALELSENPILTGGPKAGLYRSPSPRVDTVGDRLIRAGLTKRAAAPT